MLGYAIVNAVVFIIYCWYYMDEGYRYSDSKFSDPWDFVVETYKNKQEASVLKIVGALVILNLALQVKLCLIFMKYIKIVAEYKPFNKGK